MLQILNNIKSAIQNHIGPVRTPSHHPYGTRSRTFTLVSRAAQVADPPIDRRMAKDIGCRSVWLADPKDENKVGQLQSQHPTHNAQSGTGEEARNLPRIHRCPRNDPHFGKPSQRSFRRIFGQIYAPMALASGPVKPVTISACRLEILKRISLNHQSPDFQHRP